eukprot:Rhum_TRINITY_DN15056_c6_g1::Rhum_TRINITY_DN15056_c6_g1_i1::g.135353::m.135353
MGMEGERPSLQGKKMAQDYRLTAVPSSWAFLLLCAASALTTLAEIFSVGASAAATAAGSVSARRLRNAELLEDKVAQAERLLPGEDDGEANERVHAARLLQRRRRHHTGDACLLQPVDDVHLEGVVVTGLLHLTEVEDVEGDLVVRHRHLLLAPTQVPEVQVLKVRVAHGSQVLVHVLTALAVLDLLEHLRQLRLVRHLLRHHNLRLEPLLLLRLLRFLRRRLRALLLPRTVDGGRRLPADAEDALHCLDLVLLPRHSRPQLLQVRLRLCQARLALLQRRADVVQRRYHQRRRGVGDGGVGVVARGRRRHGIGVVLLRFLLLDGGDVAFVGDVEDLHGALAGDVRRHVHCVQHLLASLHHHTVHLEDGEAAAQDFAHRVDAVALHLRHVLHHRRVRDELQPERCAHLQRQRDGEHVLRLRLLRGRREHRHRRDLACRACGGLGARPLGAFLHAFGGGCAEAQPLAVVEADGHVPVGVLQLHPARLARVRGLLRLPQALLLLHLLQHVERTHGDRRTGLVSAWLRVCVHCCRVYDLQ